MPLDPHDFSKTVLSRIQPGDHVLDLGAGQGSFALMFVEHGAHVTAVDPRLPADLGEHVTAQPVTAEVFCAAPNANRYDCVFARNVIQFLDKAWVQETLFPWFANHLVPGGTVAISTFYQNPVPPFDRPMRSLYTLDELTAPFVTWTEILSRHYEHRGPDMSGQLRTFYTTDLIVRSPN
ncbi:MAG: class I SAM-dependent methyltransferase [Candidatus Kerfeldbacteria bacterium]|nr:class I SAM-dependent methyltransferase [Candidatus Kerfeldbacteria bacterium]